MAFYIGEQYTAQVATRCIKDVQCEKCGADFHYELTRTAKGFAHAPYFVGRAEAAARAERAAQQRLRKRLETECEVVPCPRCNWVNEDMVRAFRRRKYRNLPLYSPLVMAGGLVLALFLGAGLAEVFGRRSAVPRTVRSAAIIVSVLSPAWLLALRAGLRWRFNPNQTFPDRPAVPLGTPPALVEGHSELIGQTSLVPVPNRFEHAGLLEKWAVLRPGQAVLPRLCCVCMEPAPTTYSSPFKVNAWSDLAFPLCAGCAKRIRHRWWRVALLVALAILALTGLLAAAVPGLDFFERFLLFGLVSLFALAFGLAIIPSRICRPYRVRTVDAERGIIRLQAANPAYTALLIEQARRSDGEPSP
jgi:hypothetical protein